VTPRWRGAMSGAVMMAGGLSYSATAMAGGYVTLPWAIRVCSSPVSSRPLRVDSSSGPISECHTGRWREWRFPLTTADARATSIGGFRS
jgi:hypothetical protein